MRVAALLGRAAGAVTLDDEELGLRRIALLAVGQLARQRRRIERALALHHLARLAGGFARPRRQHGLLDDLLGLARVLLEEAAELLVDDALDDALHLGRDQLVLRLVGELGIGMLDRDDGRQTLADVVAAEAVLEILEQVRRLRVGVDGAGQRLRGSR